MAYTFIQLYQLHRTLADKSGSPYFPEEQFDEIFNVKYDDFVTDECKKSEQNQEHTVRIHGLYKTFTKANANTLIIPDDVPAYRYLLRFNSKYRKVCGSKITYPVVTIRKAPNNNVDVMQNDPFNKGIDADPTYVLTEAGGKKIYQVMSETVPLELGGTYVRFPAKMDSENTPAGVFELDDYVAEAIVKAVTFRTDVIIENMPRAAAELREQAESQQQ